jgi:hypothetical protein
MALVPIVSSGFGNLAGLGVLAAAFWLALWRLDRLCRGLDWNGLRDYKS